MRETWLYNLFTLSSIEIITCLIYDEESIFSTIYLLLSLFILIENFFFLTLDDMKSSPKVLQYIYVWVLRRITLQDNDILIY